MSGDVVSGKKKVNKDEDDDIFSAVKDVYESITGDDVGNAIARYIEQDPGGIVTSMISRYIGDYARTFYNHQDHFSSSEDLAIEEYIIEEHASTPVVSRTKNSTSRSTESRIRETILDALFL